MVNHLLETSHPLSPSAMRLRASVAAPSSIQRLTVLPSFPCARLATSLTNRHKIEEPFMKLSEVAQKLACRLEGPPDLEVSGVAGIEQAAPGQLTFLANRRYFPLLKTTRASAVLVEEGVALE